MVFFYKKNKFYLLLITTLIIFSIFVIFNEVKADEYGLGALAGEAGLQKYGTSIPKITGYIIGSILSLVGVVFLGLMIYGGVMWMTAGGKGEQQGKALNTMISACVGIVIVVASYAIVSFVFKSIGVKDAGEQGTNKCTQKITNNNACTAKGKQCMDKKWCKDGTIETCLCTLGADHVCCLPQCTLDKKVDLSSVCINQDFKDAGFCDPVDKKVAEDFCVISGCEDALAKQICKNN